MIPAARASLLRYPFLPLARQAGPGGGARLRPGFPQAQLEFQQRADLLAPGR